jgi:hypothetical protein
MGVVQSLFSTDDVEIDEDENIIGGKSKSKGKGKDKNYSKHAKKHKKKHQITRRIKKSKDSKKIVKDSKIN